MRVSRRALVVGVIVAVLAVPPVTQAQPGKVPRIGLLETGTLAARAPLWEAFREAMLELGYIEGQTVVFEARAAGGEGSRLSALASELVRLKVEVIVTSGSSAAQAARQATATIPIVTASGNPVELGLVTEPGPAWREPHGRPDAVHRAQPQAARGVPGCHPGRVPLRHPGGHGERRQHLRGSTDAGGRPGARRELARRDGPAPGRARRRLLGDRARAGGGSAS